MDMLRGMSSNLDSESTLLLSNSLVFPVFKPVLLVLFLWSIADYLKPLSQDQYQGFLVLSRLEAESCRETFIYSYFLLLVLSLEIYINGFSFRVKTILEDDSKSDNFFYPALYLGNSFYHIKFFYFICSSFFNLFILSSKL